MDPGRRQPPSRTAATSPGRHPTSPRPARRRVADRSLRKAPRSGPRATNGQRGPRSRETAQEGAAASSAGPSRPRRVPRYDATDDALHEEPHGLELDASETKRSRRRVRASRAAPAVIAPRRTASAVRAPADPDAVDDVDGDTEASHLRARRGPPASRTPQGDRRREPEGRRGQDHDDGQPGCQPRTVRLSGPGRRPGPSGQRDDGPRGRLPAGSSTRCTTCC